MVSSKETKHAPFPETRWSVVRQAALPDAAASGDALAELCHIYWVPIYAYLRRLGFSNHDAEDHTQEFLSFVLARDLLPKAKASVGRMRSYLLGILKKFLSDIRKRNTAQKRGGGRRPLAIDADLAESRILQGTSAELTPEQAYELHWALTVLEASVGRIRETYRKKGNEQLFNLLAPCLQGGPDLPYREAARQLGMSESALKVAAHRLRLRYRQSIRGVIAATIGPKGDVEQELAHLQAALHRK